MSSFFKSSKRTTARNTRSLDAAAHWAGLQSLEGRTYMSASPLEVGSTMAIANVMGEVSQVHSLANSISSLAEIDLFAIDVTAGQKYTFDVDGDGTFNSQLRIFDSNGKRIASNDNGRAVGEAKSLDSFATVSFKNAGRFYVGITSSGNNKYNVATGLGAKDGKTTGGYELIVTNVTPEDTAGKTLFTARDLAELDGELELTEFVGQYDSLDYFKFTLAQDSDFSLSLSGLEGNVNVRVISDLNGNGKISRNEVIGTSARADLQDESLTGELAAGTYYIEVKRVTGHSHYTLSLSGQAIEEESSVPPQDPTPEPAPVPTPDPEPAPQPEPAPGPVSDWFSQNLADSGIISLSRSLFVDGSISRGDMMQILSVAGDDDGIVDANELTDLRLIVTNANTLSITDDVRVLAAKVVNAHTANAKYQGTTLGNLAAGSSEAHLDKLVNKWFLGLDRPNATIYGATYQYRLASGSLFVGGPELTDIEQGYVGDCYLLATLGSVADIDPSAITSMFTSNGDGTFAVRFFRNGVADYVTVDMHLPTDSGGRFIFANMGNSASSSSNELWVALAEKAYAQLNEAAWIGQDGTNSYAGIEGGWMESVYEQVLGRNATSTYMFSQQAIVNAFNSDKMVTLGSNSSTNSGIIGGHAYVLKNYNASTGTFDLYNPWGVQHATGLTYAQLSSNFAWMASA